MSLYAVKNDEGKLYDFDSNGDFWKEALCRRLYTPSENEAQDVAHDYGGHVVELVEAPAKVVVPEWFDEWLDAFHGLGPKVRTIAAVGRIAQQGWGSNANVPFLGDRTLDKAVTPTLSVAQLDYVHDNKEELMVAALTGNYTVEKPKRYVLPMPGTDYHNIQMHGNAQYYAVKGTGNWRPDAIALGTDDAVKHGYTVTHADIDAAPGWVKAITPVEVTDDEQ
ncbi:DUF1642 domain-containing protein [Lacticaseibacillus salsurivasis]|uniref:DUF1642 domain-containing protein n=1 Tax=Lacticaseibacillus salsurivasis TaxID=3081441 RepID=UPI0030C6E09C